MVRHLGEAEKDGMLGFEGAKATALGVGNYVPARGACPSPETELFFPMDWPAVDLARPLRHKYMDGELLGRVYGACAHREFGPRL
eukprot:4969429-Alexandrium_andersonii.AAC.1